MLTGNLVFPFQPTTAHPDTLSSKSFKYLKGRFESSLYDHKKSNMYASAWLKKAKSGKRNYRQLALAYRAKTMIADRPLRLNYSDSMVVNARITKDNNLIATAYMSKGAIHYDRMEHLKALDNYLLADGYVSKGGDLVITYKLRYCIAQIKYYLGFYHEAVALLRDCVSFYEEENDRAYLSSLHALALCYARIGENKLATQTNQMGIEQGISFGHTEMQPYFIHSEGINQFYSSNYTDAIRKLTEALPGIIRLKDYANESVAYFYIGKSYWALKHHEPALYYFKKVDHIFQTKNYMLPDLRSGYECLIDHFTKKKDTQLQLFYINQLLKVDRLLADDYKHLLTKVVKEYDTKELLKAKNSIESSMVLTRVAAGIVVTVMAAAIIYLIYRNRRNKKLFEQLMRRDTSNSLIPGEQMQPEIDTLYITETEGNGKAAPEISPDIENAIVRKLEKFETSEKYLEKDMNLTRMATILHTNSKYVTKVVARHRGKKTIEYITELKLDYIIEKLKTDSRYRNYTHKALGEEAGFRTTQNFTRAFKSYTGITPTYFSSQLKKSLSEDNQA